MKLALAILALVVFALSFVADYKWRQWMAKRRTDQDTPHASDPQTSTRPGNDQKLRPRLWDKSDAPRLPSGMPARNFLRFQPLQ